MPIAEDPEPRPAADDDPFDGLVLDDEFVRSASVKEPSGRARMLTEKWKRQPPETEPWRSPEAPRRRRFGRRERPRDAWGNPILRPRRRRNWQAPLFVALAVAVTLAALNVDKLRGWYHGDDTPASSALPSVGPETAKPTAAAPSVAPDVPTAEHPWAGSPAEAWPEGADALVLPEAQAVGVFGKDEVAEQLKSVKAFLVAANIDPATLHGATPQAALALLDRKDRDMVEDYLAHPSEEKDPTSWFSRFDPKLAIPVTDVVKVQGRITFESDGEKGLLVHTDVSFVYALRPGPEAGRAPAPAATPSQNGSGGTGGGDAKPVSLREASAGPVEREIVRREQDFRFYDPARYQVKRGKLVFGHEQSDFANNVCEMGSGFLETDFPVSAPTGSPAPHSSGPATDPYDRSKPLDRQEGCGTVTRT